MHAVCVISVEEVERLDLGSFFIYVVGVGLENLRNDTQNLALRSPVRKDFTCLCICPLRISSIELI